MDILTNYIFRFAFILLAGWMIRNAIITYRGGALFLCGFSIAFAVYFLIYLVKAVFDI